VSDLAITGLSLVCPVGLNAVHACAAMRAGISRLAEYEGYFAILPEGPAEEASEGPEPITAGRVPTVPDDLTGRERLLALALPALRGLIAESGLRRKDLPRTGLLVALPAEDPGTAQWQLGKTFAPELCRRSGLSGWPTVRSFEGGPAGALKAVETGRALLDAGGIDFCVVLAVDTLVSADRLTHLDQSWRLRSLRNPDGLIPGEAGCALLLESRRAAERRKATIFGLLSRVALANEAVTVSADRWSTGSGLCAVLRPLLTGRDGAAGRYVLCDLNGEAYRAREWGVAQVRLGREAPPVETLLHPAQAIGDAGTAMAGVLVASACQSFVHGYAPAPVALVWVSSDDGGRAAVAVHPPPKPA
jgi:3-oxoacyl-[acyl-carrier-protein] synthase-1